MKRYPIFAFSELNCSAKKASLELRQLNNWSLWTDIKITEAQDMGLYAIDFGIQQPIVFPVFHFKQLPTTNLLHFRAVFIANRLLSIEWKMFIRKEDGLLINIIWMEGQYAQNYYEIFGPTLTQIFKKMNLDFQQYLHKVHADYLFKNNGYNISFPLN